MWWKYDEQKKARFIKENEWLLSKPFSYITGQGLAFGFFIFLFQAAYLTFFAEGEPLYWAKWITFFTLCIITGVFYGVLIYFVNKYYLRKFRSELFNK